MGRNLTEYVLRCLVAHRNICEELASAQDELDSRPPREL